MNRRILLLVALLLATGTPAWGQDAIGYVKTVSGHATVTDAGKLVAAQPGTPIRLGNILKTGPQGAMGITFNDNTVMSFGPDTELTVDEFLYDPARSKLGFGTSISRGTLEVVSGVIAKLRPAAATVKTPTGTIGMRGTHFLVKIEP